MYEPDVSGGAIRLFVIGECGNVGFPSCFRNAGNLLFGLRKQSQSVGHSEHVFVYPMYQLPKFVIPPDCLLRVPGHALVVILARVPGQLVCDGFASPVVFGNLAVILTLLRLMSWDPSHSRFMVSTPQVMIASSQPQISIWLVNPSRWFVPPVLDPRQAFNNRLIVDGNGDGSRSVGGDDGGSKLHPCGIVDGGAHRSMSSRLVVPRFSKLFLDGVKRVRVHLFPCRCERCQFQRRRPRGSSGVKLMHL